MYFIFTLKHSLSNLFRTDLCLILYFPRAQKKSRVKVQPQLQRYIKYTLLQVSVFRSTYATAFQQIRRRQSIKGQMFHNYLINRQNYVYDKYWGESSTTRFNSCSKLVLVKHLRQVGRTRCVSSEFRRDSLFCQVVVYLARAMNFFAPWKGTSEPFSSRTPKLQWTLIQRDSLCWTDAQEYTRPAAF